jgi:excinuclease ABC subunit C
LGRIKISKLQFLISNADEKSEKFLELDSKISFLKYQLLNLEKVLEHSRVLSVGEKYAADVVELAKILSLPKVPERIEGYDISNIFGREAVGSMVVFENGEPNKSEYKKFKIKNLEATGDIGMLKEILERRFKHAGERVGETKFLIGNLVSDGSSDGSWGLPDLIIVDGGKGQLNAILSVLRKFKINLPVIAISKGEGLRSSIAPDKIFFPGEKKPLVLPLASPALHLIKRVRDEAHRFAIGFHRKLRSKSFLK